MEEATWNQILFGDSGTDHQRDGRDPTSERCRKYCTKSALSGEAFKLQLRHYMARRKIEGKLSEVHFQWIHFGRNNMEYLRATFWIIFLLCTLMKHGTRISGVNILTVFLVAMYIERYLRTMHGARVDVTCDRDRSNILNPTRDVLGLKTAKLPCSPTL